MKIRPFVPAAAEYEAIFAVEQAVWPDNPTTIAEWKYGDETWKQNVYHRRWVIELCGQIVGFATANKITRATEPGRYQFNITIHPDYEGRGLAAAVYGRLTADLGRQSPAVTTLQTGAYAHKERAVRFLKKRGFQEVMRWVISTLDVRRFEGHQFAKLRQQVTVRGILIKPVTQLAAEDPDWQQQLYELDWACTVDEPAPYLPQKPTFAAYVRRYIEHPAVLPAAWFVALDKGRYVGMTQLEKNETQPTRCTAGFTGVRRSYRRRGVATALKLQALAYAQKSGIHMIRTGNEENNPMYHLNKKLGFADLTANIAFEKRLAAREEN